MVFISAVSHPISVGVIRWIEFILARITSIPTQGEHPLTKQYFEKHGEACAADIYYALSREIERMNKERIETGEKPLERPNYSSFAKYFHWFKLLGLVERTDRKEPAIYDFLEKRVVYRLTGKGQAEVRAWEDPVRAAHPEFG